MKLLLAFLLIAFGGPALAAISIVSVGTPASESNSSGTDSVVNFTAGFLENDLLFGCISASQNALDLATTHTWPAGWTEIVEISTDAGTGNGINCAWHKAASDDEIASVTATAAATTGYLSVGVVIRGQDLTTPIDVKAEGTTQPNAANNTTPTVTTTIDNVLVVRLVAVDDNLALTFSDPGAGGSALRFSVQLEGGGNGTSFGWYDLLETSAGVTGTEVISWTGDSEENISFTFGFRPAVAGSSIAPISSNHARRRRS